MIVWLTGTGHARALAVLPASRVVLPILGGICVGLGLVLAVATIRLFMTVGEGTIAPWDPPQRLVVRGVYRHVRNPMITGLCLVLLGEAILAASLPLLGLFALGVIVNVIYIPLSEEPGLARRFGDDYLAYKRNVPRWIPRLTPWKADDLGRWAGRGRARLAGFLRADRAEPWAQAPMKILFLHGWHSVPGGVKPSFLSARPRGHQPGSRDDDFDEAVRTAQAEFDRHRPDVIVGSSRGGAVAMNIDSGSTPLVLLCPAWKRWGTARTVKPGTVILHSEADDVIPFADSRELVRASGLPESALIVVGTDHRLADPEPLAGDGGGCCPVRPHTLPRDRRYVVGRFTEEAGVPEGHDRLRPAERRSLFGDRILSGGPVCCPEPRPEATDGTEFRPRWSPPCRCG